MILNVHSDASYMSAGKERSHAGGYLFLGTMTRDGKPIQINGNVAVMCAILKIVASSAVKAELSALFVNRKEARIICLILEELGHPQQQTPIHINNTPVVGKVNSSIKRQQSVSLLSVVHLRLPQPQSSWELFKVLIQHGESKLSPRPVRRSQ